MQSASRSALPHGQQSSPYTAQQQQQQSQKSPSLQYSPADTPNISIHQSAPQTPQTPQFSSTQPSSGIPGALQPGLATRPGLISAYTTPSSVPTVPQINTNAQQYNLPTRPTTMASSHSYSRSSPAGLEQKYVPFSNRHDSPESAKSAFPDSAAAKFLTSQGQKLYSPHTPSGAMSYSPLALADIRPRADSSLDDAFGGTLGFNDRPEKAPTNSNYLAPWAVYAFDWCKWPVHGGNNAGKIAIGSYLEDPHNYIQILDTQIVPQEVNSPGAPPYGIDYTRVAEATCSFPITKILWEPPSQQKSSTDLLATSGDHLRLWSIPQNSGGGGNTNNTITRSSSNGSKDVAQKLTPLALLSNSKSPEHTAPLTSLDWNMLSPKLIITSSIDTTCTIWDIPTLTAKTQLIAHDKEVYDVRFCAGSVDVFVSCGADGSVRMFDLRSLEHSTIIYEPSEKPGSPSGRMSPTKAQQTMSYAPPLLRLAASPHDAHLLATFAADSNIVRILDVRQPGQALLELRGHGGPVNNIEWTPTRRGMLASGGDDALVLVWDLLHSANGAALNGDASSGGSHSIDTSHSRQLSGSVAGPGSGSGSGAGSGSGPGSGVAGGGGNMNAKGPAVSWRCDYEIANLSWAPQSHLTSHGGEWVGVCGGRGIWGVKL